MTELLLHFAIPFIATSYFKRPREAFLASLVALIPDLDVFFYVHRSLTHSIIVNLAMCAVVYLFVWGVKSRYRGFIALATLSLMSHLVLDLFTAHTPILWPLMDESIQILVIGGLHISSGVRPIIALAVSTEKTSFIRFTSLDASIFTGEGVVMSAILLVLATLKMVKVHKSTFA